MYSYWRIPLLLLILSYYLRGYSSNHPYRFDHLTIDNGLSQNLVYDILQDFRGFMWFATHDGLNRYDGTQFRTYYHNSQDSLTPFKSTCSSLHEDSRKRLWLGAGGLNLYDRTFDRFIRVLSPHDFPGNVHSDHVLDIEEDHNGDLWIAFEKAGLFRVHWLSDILDLEPLDAIEWQKIMQVSGPYPFREAREGSFPYIKKIVSINNALWISSEAGVDRLQAKSDGQYLDPAMAVFESLPYELPGTMIFGSLMKDKDESLWIGTSHGLLRLPDPNDMQAFEEYPYPEGQLYNLWWSIPRSMSLGPDGLIWIATFNGIEIFDPKNISFKNIRHNSIDPESLAHNNIPVVYLDYSGVVWVGTSGKGISKYAKYARPFSKLVNQSMSDGQFSTFSLVEDRQGYLWIAYNNNELGVFERKQDGTMVLRKAFSYDAISDITLDSNGFVWFVSDEELVCMDPDNFRTLNTYTTFQRNPTVLQRDSIPKLMVDEQNNIWLCNAGRICKLDRKLGIVEDFLFPQNQLGQVTALLNDKEGVFWIGTERGLFRLRMETGVGEFVSSKRLSSPTLPFNSIKSLLLDPREERYLWIGTAGGGLIRLDIETDSMLVFNHDAGLSNNFIYGILNDEIGNLWISTNRGLSFLDTSRKHFTVYTVDDGLQSNEFNSRSYFKNNSGEIFFGGINGVTFFHPSEIRPNPNPPNVVLTDLYLSYHKVDIANPNSPLRQSVTQAGKLRLPYDQNTLAIEFAALDYTQPEQNFYRYKMKGFDEDWIFVNNDHRATYTNLPSGHFTFMVEGSNNDGLFSSEPAVLDVIIDRPPWLQWWAFLIYVTIAGIIIYLSLKYYQDQNRLRKELNQRQMEAEKIKELDEFKSRFFTNISHEFRTPLTLIQGRLEELKQTVQQSELTKKIISAQKNTGQVLNLIEQLLDIAKLESGGLKLHLYRGDLISFMDHLISNMQPFAREKEVKLEFQSNAEYCFVDFDKSVSEKIIQNLVINALKFSPQNSTVRVNLMIGDDTVIDNEVHKNVVIEVSDQGIGIPEKFHSHIFDRFFQIDLEDRKEQGFGLGLALVKELISLQKGTIELKSKVGSGTTFRISIPFRKSSLEHAVAPELSKDKEIKITEEKKSFRGIKETVPSNLILIVEDNDELRQYIFELLNVDHRVLVASNGNEALLLAHKHLPDLILSDIMMPGMDGYSFATRLSNDPSTSHIPVIFLTAKSTLDDRLDALNLGVDDYLIKPFEARELKARVNNLIRKRALLREHFSGWFQSGMPISEIENHREKVFLRSVKDLIGENVDNSEFGVDLLAQHIGMSSSNLYRKLQALINMSPVQMIQQVRIEKAAKYLIEGYNVSEAAYQAGFRSPSYFSQVFKKHYHLTPKEFVQKQSNVTYS